MKLVTLLVCSALVGCGTTKPDNVRYQKVEVKVPVMVPVPMPEEPNRPELIIHTLTEADRDDPGLVVTAYKASVKQLQGYVLELEHIIDGYRKLSKAQQDESK